MNKPFCCDDLWIALENHLFFYLVRKGCRRFKRSVYCSPLYYSTPIITERRLHGTQLEIIVIPMDKRKHNSPKIYVENYISHRISSRHNFHKNLYEALWNPFGLKGPPTAEIRSFVYFNLFFLVLWNVLVIGRGTYLFFIIIIFIYLMMKFLGHPTLWLLTGLL